MAARELRRVVLVAELPATVLTDEVEGIATTAERPHDRAGAAVDLVDRRCVAGRHDQVAVSGRTDRVAVEVVPHPGSEPCASDSVPSPMRRSAVARPERDVSPRTPLEDASPGDWVDLADHVIGHLGARVTIGE